MTSNFDVLMGLNSVLDFSGCWVDRESESDYFQSLLSDQGVNKEIRTKIQESVQTRIENLDDTLQQGKIFYDGFIIEWFILDGVIKISCAVSHRLYFKVKSSWWYDDINSPERQIKVYLSNDMDETTNMGVITMPSRELLHQVRNGGVSFLAGLVRFNSAVGYFRIEPKDMSDLSIKFSGRRDIIQWFSSLFSEEFNKGESLRPSDLHHFSLMLEDTLSVYEYLINSGLFFLAPDKQGKRAIHKMDENNYKKRDLMAPSDLLLFIDEINLLIHERKEEVEKLLDI
jgi:hypothetical protein